MGVVRDLVQEMEIPKFYKVQNHLDATHIEDVPQAVRDALKREGTLDLIKPGSTVCFTAASREIANSVVILRTFAEELKRIGATPYIVPAMGSHGGATAEGQLAILTHYGITEEACGCKIHSCMDTKKIGVSAEGLDVELDAFALSCDYIVPVARIKPHTDFHGPFESGIMKMMAIGLGKQYGASICHKRGFNLMHINVPSFGRTALANCNIPFAIGIVENAFHQTHTIRAIPNKCIEAEEPELLLQAKSLMAAIPFEKINVLMLEQIGKEISGDGMDPNVVGRAYDYRVKPFIERIGVLDLSPKTGANFNGIGNADATTRKVLDKGSFEETYPNAITSITTEYARIPCVLDTDKLCFQFCLRTCPNLGEPLKVLWTKDTLHMGEFYVSESLLPEIEANPDVTTDGKLYMPVFDEEENFKGFEEV
ncbi:MAG: DUF2088 domain-containing protein [Oscillibacter sp.]|nr:DUF2088 domain-containing protein [Oscillibacter sp.]